MTRTFPPAPPSGTAMLAARPSPGARAMLALRRSAGKGTLAVPGPDAHRLDELIAVAARVPDHRRLEPWRFVVIEGEARVRLGEACARIGEAKDPAAGPAAQAEDRARFLRAPVVVCVVSSPDAAHKTPVWEQELSAGAVCHNLLLAANAAGWAGTWLTEWVAYDPDVAAVLGLGANERIAGFIYLGTATVSPPERPRPALAAKVRRWEA